MWWKRILAVKVSLVVAILAVLLVNSTDRVRQRAMEIRYLKHQTEILKLQADLYKTQATQQKKFTEAMMGMECRDLRVVKVAVTSYNPTKKQCDSTPLIGANDKLVTPGQVAISRDLSRRYKIKLGDKIMLEGFGTFTVSDYMNSRWRKRVDIISFIPTWSSKFGCKSNINLYFNKN